MANAFALLEDHGKLGGDVFFRDRHDFPAHDDDGLMSRLKCLGQCFWIHVLDWDQGGDVMN